MEITAEQRNDLKRLGKFPQPEELDFIGRSEIEPVEISLSQARAFLRGENFVFDLYNQPFNVIPDPDYETLDDQFSYEASNPLVYG